MLISKLIIILINFISAHFSRMERRGRGRPRGSKNKVQKNLSLAEGADAQQDTNLRIGKQKNATKPIKQPKQVQEVNYEYTDLAKISLGNTEMFNIYAVVICAASPH